MATYDLSRTNRQNDETLVCILNLWLNAVGASNPRARLPETEEFSAATEAALRSFQARARMSIDGVCRIRTWQSLARAVMRQARPGLVNFPMRNWLNSLLGDRDRIDGGRLRIDQELFITMYGVEFALLDDTQTGGLRQLLGFFAQDADVSDVRWIAYMLATVYTECQRPRGEGRARRWAPTWAPTEENDRGASRMFHTVRGRRVP